VLTFAVPRKLLDGASAIGFGIVSADLVGPGESEGEEFERELEALDAAPDNLELLYPYRLVNPGPLVLRAGRSRPCLRVNSRVGRSRSGRRAAARAWIVRKGSWRAGIRVGTRLRGTGRLQRKTVPTPDPRGSAGPPPRPDGHRRAP
jgi:hypothetical protein